MASIKTQPLPLPLPVGIIPTVASLGDQVVLEAFNEAVVGAATELMSSVEEERRVGLFEAHIYFSQG